MLLTTSVETAEQEWMKYKNEYHICLETFKNNIEAQVDCIPFDVQVWLPTARYGSRLVKI